MHNPEPIPPTYPVKKTIVAVNSCKIDFLLYAPAAGGRAE